MRSCRGRRSFLSVFASCVLSAHAGSIIMHQTLRAVRLPAKGSASAMKTFQGQDELHGLWGEVCLLCTLAAAPAAKDVDAKKNENGTKDTCHEREKKRGSGPSAPRPLFP